VKIRRCSRAEAKNQKTAIVYILSAETPERRARETSPNHTGRPENPSRRPGKKTTKIRRGTVRLPPKVASNLKVFPVR